MATDKINSLLLQRQRLSEIFRRTPRAARPQVTGAGANSGDSVERASLTADKAEISATAHQLMALRREVVAGREALAVEPEVRTDRIDEVRARLERGYYRSVSVEDTVAERLGRLIRDMEDL